MPQFAKNDTLYIARPHRTIYDLTSVENPPVKVLGWIGKSRLGVSLYAIELNGKRVQIAEHMLRPPTARELRRKLGGRLERKRRRRGKLLNPR